jgi:hypothetical protein
MEEVIQIIQIIQIININQLQISCNKLRTESVIKEIFINPIAIPKLPIKMRMITMINHLDFMKVIISKVVLMGYVSNHNFN